jgi:hypothetical protein
MAMYENYDFVNALKQIVNDYMRSAGYLDLFKYRGRISHEKRDAILCSLHFR